MLYIHNLKKKTKQYIVKQKICKEELIKTTLK